MDYCCPVPTSPYANLFLVASVRGAVLFTFLREHSDISPYVFGHRFFYECIYQAKGSRHSGYKFNPGVVYVTHKGQVSLGYHAAVTGIDKSLAIYPVICHIGRYAPKYAFGNGFIIFISAVYLCLYGYILFYTQLGHNILDKIRPLVLAVSVVNFKRAAVLRIFIGTPHTLTEVVS